MFNVTDSYFVDGTKKFWLTLTLKSLVPLTKYESVTTMSCPDCLTDRSRPVLEAVPHIFLPSSMVDFVP